MVRNAHHAYTTAQVEGMSPGKLVLALYDGALKAVSLAMRAIDDKDIPTRGEQISKALGIVAELQMALDMEKGGEIAQNLDGLYDYMSARLLRANLDKDRVALEECHKILSEIRNGWEEMLESNPQSAASAPTPSTDADPPPRLRKAGYL